MATLSATKTSRSGNLGSRRMLLAPVVPVAGLLVWYFATRHSTNPAYPHIEAVVGSVKGLITEDDLFAALGISLMRVAIGFLIALLVGGGTGLVMGRSRLVREAADPLIEVFRPIAPIALVPLAILWLGAGNASPIAIIAYAAFFPVVLNVTAAARAVEPNLVNAARTFGVGRFTAFFRVILPAVVPGLIVGARIGMGFAWTSVVAAELAAGTGATGPQGIGTLMLTLYSYAVDPNPIVVCMICVGILGIALDALLRKVGAVLTPWQ